MTNRRLTSLTIAFVLVVIPITVAAQGGSTVEVVATATCGVATFETSIADAEGSYDLLWDFGDAESDEILRISEFPFTVTHPYTDAGEYAWELTVSNNLGAVAQTSGPIFIDGPSVMLLSEPFPPLVVLENGEATVDFTANVSGGKGAYTFSWDFDGGGSDSSEAGAASFTYTEAGKYQVTVNVTDECFVTGQDTLPVVVIDPDEEACHPMAQRIADGVNTLFPDQAGDLYTCEDIFDIFQGGLTGSQTGFGRLWHAYKLAETIQDLTWEEIRDWQLDGNGWGGLVQLNRFADLLEEHGIRDLVGLVVGGEASITDIRHSVRSVLRYEADFDDALARLGDGMSPGELGRFYSTAQDLGLDSAQLDSYLDDGSSLQELSHAARLGERSGSDWIQIAEAHAAGYSWGEIGQAQRLSDNGDWMSTLDTGIRETRDLLREEDRTEREQKRVDRTAEQLAARYGISEQEVLDLYDGDCGQDWGCVRKELRNSTQSSAVSDQEQKTAARLAKQYGVNESEVWSLFDGSCGGSWSCVRAELRGDSGHGGGPKPKD
jgi:PKD repeat protein